MRACRSWCNCRRGHCGGDDDSSGYRRYHRFPGAKKLVGYAGLGARVHDSGQSRQTGKITKAGRRDLRHIMVEAAQTAANCHPHWQAELARLQPRLGRNKAIVAIARKLLVAVWHLLSKGNAARFSSPQRIARQLLQHAYRLGQANRPRGQRPAAYVRQQLDRLGIGAKLTHIPWGANRSVFSRSCPLPSLLSATALNSAFTFPLDLQIHL